MKTIAGISTQSTKVVPSFVVVLDGCPSDRMQGDDETWHTLALLEAGSWKDVEEFIARLKMSLKSAKLQLRKWGGNAENPKRNIQDIKYRIGFLAALREALPGSRVALSTVSCQEKTIVASERKMCERLGLEYVIVAMDTPSVNLSGYIRHPHNGKEMVTLAAFEKLSLNGSSEAISSLLVARHTNAIIWLWMGYILNTLYKNIEAAYQTKPSWWVHFDRLANDQADKNYPGLGFVNQLLSTSTTISLEATYTDSLVLPDGKKDSDTPPDLVVDCIAGWINSEVSKNFTKENLEEELREGCKSHLDFQIVTDSPGLVALKFDVLPQS